MDIQTQTKKYGIKDLGVNYDRQGKTIIIGRRNCD